MAGTPLQPREKLDRSGSFCQRARAFALLCSSPELGSFLIITLLLYSDDLIIPTLRAKHDVSVKLSRSWTSVKEQFSHLIN
jgi:hypothetical protein